MLSNSVSIPDPSKINIPIYIEDIIIGDVKEIPKIEIYFNALNKQIKFFKDIEDYDLNIGDEIIFIHAHKHGPCKIFMTKADEDNNEQGAKISKNSNKDTARSHKYCVSAPRNLFKQMPIAQQPPSSKIRKDGSKGEQGFYVWAEWTSIPIHYNDGKVVERNGFLFDLEPWIEDAKYDESVNLKELFKNV
jgi:hypothetical protein